VNRQKSTRSGHRGILVGGLIIGVYKRTEAELVESVNSNLGTMYSSFNLYLTVTMAYLVAAYLVGAKLTRSQVMIISGLFVAVFIMSLIEVIGNGSRAMEYVAMLKQMHPERSYMASPLMPYAGAILLGAGIAASLKFMWDVRHPKTE
jgi:hypothetical protein